MKAASPDPALPGHFRELGQDPDLDRGQCLRVDRHPEEATGTARRPVHHPTCSGSHAMHASAVDPTAYGAGPGAGGGSGHAPDGAVRDLSSPAGRCGPAPAGPARAIAGTARDKAGILHFRVALAGCAQAHNPFRINELRNPRRSHPETRPTLLRKVLILKAFQPDSRAST